MSSMPRRKAAVFDALYSIPESGDYQPFLDELRAATGSSVVNGILAEPGVPGGLVTSVGGVAPSDYQKLESAYFEVYGGYNPMIASVQHVLRTGRILRASDFASFEVLRKSAYFRDFMHPLDADYTAGIVVESGSQGTGWLSLSKPVGGADYTDADMALLRELSAPLQRVCRLLAAAPGREYSWELLDASGMSAAIVDTELNCRRTTAALDDLLSRRSLLIISRGGLVGVEPATDALLQNLRNQVSALDKTASFDHAPELSLHDSGGCRWILTAMTHLMGLARDEILILLRAVGPSCTPEKRLIRMYGLTLAEARCALSLARAPNVQRLARHLGVSTNTVKSQLSQVFRKTGTGNQVRLLVLLARQGLIAVDANELSPR